ncbi:glycosyltransferase [Mariniflexile sp. HMF6888]|uniref:glycosyltransferase n=1 Tax=Mariniflexile sp. HMF6888 TaxID=3373086 RepID=UPI0037A3BB94
MKRILQVVGTMDRAGAETMVMNLYRAIDRTQYQFDFVYFTERSCSYDDEILSLGGKVYRISEKDSKNPIARTYQLYKIIKKNKPFHAVHCHQLLANSFHLTAGYIGGIKRRLVHAHSTQDFNSKSVIRSLYQKISKLVISILATDFIACGKEAGDFLFPNKYKDIIFIPNAIDVHKFLKAGDLKKNIEYFNNNKINNETLILCQIGRFMPVKNHIFSVNFALFLKEKGLDFHMLFVGGGYLEDEIKELVNSNELGNNITFLGVRKDIDIILSNSDVLLMPSLYEGFPVILVESQAVGTPALISEGISNEVDLGLNLVKFCSLNQLSDVWYDALISLINNEKFSSKIRHNVLKQKGFDIEVSVKKLEKIYNK